jgi:hypothetical protein
MGFSIRIAPGVRIRASSRGIRTSVGPRIARVHVGGGRTGVSTGIGPVSLYGSLGGKSARRPRSQGHTHGSPNVQSSAANRAAEAARIADTLKSLLNAHRGEFSSAQRPTAPAPTAPDRGKILSEYEYRNLKGIGKFKRAERAEARREAQRQADEEVARLISQAQQEQALQQEQLDNEWEQLLRNDVDVTLRTIAAAFEDNELASAPIDVADGEVSVALVVPQPSSSIPDRFPEVSAAGNIVLRRATKKEQGDFYKILICGQVLITVRETLAMAPGARAVRIVALRNEGNSAFGEPRLSCMLAVCFDRADIDRVDWAGADAATIVNDIGRDLLNNQCGPVRALSPVDLDHELELRKLIESVDMEDFVGGGQSGHEVSGETRRAVAYPSSSHIRESPTVGETPILGRGNPVVETLAFLQEQTDELARAMVDESPSREVRQARSQEVVQRSVDSVTKLFGDLSDEIMKEASGEGVNQMAGIRALSHLREAVPIMEKWVKNSKGRNPADMMKELLDTLPPLHRAYVALHGDK